VEVEGRPRVGRDGQHVRGAMEENRGDMEENRGDKIGAFWSTNFRSKQWCRLKNCEIAMIYLQYDE